MPNFLVKKLRSGRLGLIISLVLFIVAILLKNRINLPQIFSNHLISIGLSVFFAIIFIIIFSWSVKSLPRKERDRTLCTKCVYKYFRHPIYAAFLSAFNLGLAFLLNNYIYLIWAILLHPIWHLIINQEEKLLIDIFGNDYVVYQASTGRFIPKIIKTKNIT
jgi:protein-S-isoprenylcysteine O-methyltransferase Ste14